MYHQPLQPKLNHLNPLQPIQNQNIPNDQIHNHNHNQIHNQIQQSSSAPNQYHHLPPIPPLPQNGFSNPHQPHQQHPLPLPPNGPQNPALQPSAHGYSPANLPSAGTPNQPMPMPMPAPDADALAYGLSRMDIAHNQSPYTDAAQPAKTKRPARAFHQEPTAAPSYASPMPPRPDLNTGEVFRHRPDRPAHQQHYEHRPMPLGPSEPALDAGAMPPLPHAPGQRLQGPRNRIDPNQIPSPVVVHEQDAEQFEHEPFRTCQAIHAAAPAFGAPPPAPPQVPLSLTEFVALDEGNCSPRFVRATTYCFPQTEDLAAAAELPLGLLIQPLAELGAGEGDAVPYADFSDDPTGPPRCTGCRGYINPWCSFVDGGQRFRCNLCGKASDVPPGYFCHLDMSGRRVDHYQRPELCRGSVDFIVNRDYWVQSDSSDTSLATRTPEPLRYLFAIDVSWSACRSGVLQEVTQAIKAIIFDEQPPDEDDDLGPPGRPRRRFVQGSRVGFVTFDRTVHFYNLKAGLEQAQMLVVPDLEDMFVPIGEECLYVDPCQSRAIVENLLDSLPGMFGETTTTESAVGGPVMAALASLKRLGGQVNIFLTSLPTIGPGALKQREDTKLYNTEKELSLFSPADPWYRQISEECSLAGIGINLFLFPSQYIDVATLSVLAGITGGEVFFHPRFTAQRDGCKVHAELRRVLTRETACSVTMRIRCSNGLRVSEHFGSFLQRNVTDLEFGNLDADKAIAAVIKVEGKLEERAMAQFQCALLYTSADGQRRVRCHNLCLPVTQVMGNVFRSADMDGTMALVTKQYIAQVTQVPLREVRAALTERCVRVLLAYRKHCASSTSPGQLILPESYKLFPLYALGLMKTKALKGGNVSSDVRTHYMRYLKSMGVAASVLMLYPRMMALHKLPRHVGEVKANGRIELAPLMRASYLRMEPDGVYLLENGDAMLLWVGSSVSPLILRSIFGVDSIEDIDPKLSRLPKLSAETGSEEDLSKRIRRILRYYEEVRGGRKVFVGLARQGKDGGEVEFANLLVEDQNNDAMSYVDYLCYVHKQIQNDLSGVTETSNSNSGGGGGTSGGDGSGSLIDTGSLWRAAW